MAAVVEPESKKRKVDEVTTSSSKPILYSYWRSSSAWRVRICLALKGIDYEYRAVNLLKSEQGADDYTTKNPMKQVPFLEADGVGIGESLAIIEYLDETRLPAVVLPTDPVLRARARQLALIVVSDIQPVQNLRVLTRIAAKCGGDEHKQEWAKYWIEYGLRALEQEVKHSTGAYLVYDKPTVADACLIPQLYNARRFNCDMTLFPNLVRIEAALEKLPAFIAAHPDNQPDAVKVAPAAPVAAAK